MTTEDRIKALESQIASLKNEQAKLKSELAAAEVDRWQERIDDLEVQVHLGAMDTNDRVRALLDQLRHRWAAAKAQAESRSSVASDSVGAVGDSLRTAFNEIRQILIDAKHKLAS
jgi:hypothetical protein